VLGGARIMGSTNPESRNEAGRASHTSGHEAVKTAGLVSRFRARFIRADAPATSKPPPPPPLPSPPAPARQPISGEELARKIREKVDDPQAVRFADLKVTGDVNLSHCRIENTMRFTNCEFERFCAPDAVMFGLSFTNCSMTAFGAESAKFGSHLNFTGCHVGPEGIVAENIRVESDCRIAGTTCLGPINFADGIFQGDIVLQDVTLRDQKLTLDDAAVAGSLRIKECDFKGSTLELGSMKVAFRIEILKLKHHPHHLYFTGTSTTTYKEDESAWPDTGGLRIDRFTYDRLSVDDLSVKQLLRWLRLQDPKHLYTEDFRSHPWRHLAALLKRRGAVDKARELSIAYRDAMLNSGVYSGSAKIAHAFFKYSCGYGLKPWLPVKWLAGVILVGAVFFEAAAITHLVRPADSVYVLGLKSKTLGLDKPPKEYPVFNPFLYSLENTLPAVNLGQNEHFHVHVGWHGDKDLEISQEMKTLRSPWASSIAGILGIGLATAGATALAILLSVLIPLQAIIGVILVSLTVLSFTGVFEQRLLD
jgi:hypothetical protein